MGANSKIDVTEGMLTMDGYEDCIAGIVERFGQESIVCYDKEKVLKKLQDDGMEEDEAIEFFYFNQLGAWMGEGTPCFISLAQESNAS